MDDQKKNSTKYAFCYSSYLYNNYQSFKDGTLIIDTRDAQSYSNHHIKGSISLSTQRIKNYLQSKPTYTEETKLTIQDFQDILSNEETKKFAKRRRCYCFLKITENSLPRTFLNELKRLANVDDHEDSFLISEASVQGLLQRTLEENEEKDSIVTGLEIFKLLQKDKVRELFVLIDGSSNFFCKYPYMANLVSSGPNPVPVYTSLKSQLEYDFPHDILEGRLFLGSFNQSGKHCLITNLKITHIVNITHECENVHEDKGIKYLKLPILDEPDKNIRLHFKKAYDFMNEALSEDSHNNILVHCAMGKSRSATIVIMYLMKKFSWSFEKAYAYVKRKRSIVDPNEGFVKQLQDFERNKLSFVEVVV